MSDMNGVLVTGRVGLIDAQVVRFLRGIQERFGRVWIGQVIPAFAPVVDFFQIQYLLSRLCCVAGVAPTADNAWRLPHVGFPSELISQALALVNTGVTNDDHQPVCSKPEELLASRPNPFVLVSGCFDLIHAGHIRLIELAAKYASQPVVAALTTRAIRAQPKNTNRNRPLWSMADRVTLLEELRSRPRVLLFDGPDCLELIDRLRPDLWIKERRDRGRPIVEQEARLVEQLGGRVVWEDAGEFSHSSTTIEQSILALRQPV